MNTKCLFLATLILLSPFALAANQTLTGAVSDDMCGKKHMSSGKSDADCTRECVKLGSGYALVVGDKVYKLKGAADQLDKYAGAKVTVTGDVKGDTVQVAKVAPAK
jgi:hypothetical protein